MTDNYEISTPKARGERARALRSYLRYSRRSIAEKYNFKSSTLQNWEDGRYGGLTEQGAQLLSSVYRKEGLDCSIEWLMYAIGENPLEQQALPDAVDDRIAQYQASEKEAISKELQLFYELHEQATDTIVADDSMQPIFYSGDRVAGQCLFTDFEKALGYPVIVQLASGENLVCFLEAKRGNDKFVFVAANQDQPGSRRIVEAANILSIALVMWVRRSAILIKP